MKEAFDKILERLEETDFNDVQMVVREVLLKYGFPYESVVQDEVWDALDELSANKIAKKIVQEVAEEFATDTNVGTNRPVQEKEETNTADMCEWKEVIGFDYMYIKNPHTNRLYSNEPSMKNIYCNTCGKKIKVV